MVPGMRETRMFLRMVSWVLLFFVVSCGGGGSGSSSGGAAQTPGGGTSPSPGGDTASLTKQFGSARFDGASSTAVDAAGNVYIAGNTWGTVDSASPNPDATAATSDIFIAKYDRAGTLQWIRQMGTAQNDYATGVAVDKSANVIVGGFTFGSLFSANLGGSDFFVMKLDPSNGNRTWEIQDGTPELEEVWGVTTDRNDNVYLAGGTRGVFGFIKLGDFDTFLVSYTSDGVQRWVSDLALNGFVLNGFDLDMGRAVAVDDDRGFVYVTGDRYTLKLHPDNTTFIHDSDIFVVRTDTATGSSFLGAFLYGIVANDNTPMSSFATGVAIDRFGEVFVSGYTIERDKEFTSNAGDVTFELFKLDLSVDMHLLWHSYKPAGPHPGNKALGVAVDSMEDVYLTGYVSIQLDSSGDPHLGGTDAFLMQFDGNSGATLWTRQFGTVGNDRAFGVAIDKNRAGDVHHVVGETFGSMDGNLNLGGYDAFSAQFDQFGNRL
jgi:hypothetical protein